jgi:transposase-like protein
MKIKITLYCPDCQSAKIKKNGKKSFKKQNFICKDCGRQFIATTLWFIKVVIPA